MITEEEKQAHREAVAVRLQVVHINAERNVARMHAQGGKLSSDAAQEARCAAIEASPKSRANKIAALWKWADEAGEEMMPHTACRKRCSHCCHIAVLVPKAEAELIAARTGHKLGRPTVQRGGDPSTRTVPGRGYEDIPWGYEHPCTFLKAGRCSIYAHRPMMCRTHFNFDNDELLCKCTLAPETTTLPMWDHMRSSIALAKVCGLHGQVADIREWFPAV
jgi:Fe-S-cluster containining protein